MELPNLIKEAILQANISLEELKIGKIYGGVLETHLYKLTQLSEEELQEIINTGNQVLIKECKEIFQEAKEAWEIIKEFENVGLNEEQVNRIRSLLERVKMLENIVAEQEKHLMSRRELLRKSAMAAGGVLARPLMTFAQQEKKAAQDAITFMQQLHAKYDTDLQKRIELNKYHATDDIEYKNEPTLRQLFADTAIVYEKLLSCMKAADLLISTYQRYLKDPNGQDLVFRIPYTQSLERRSGELSATIRGIERDVRIKELLNRGTLLEGRKSTADVYRDDFLGDMAKFSQMLEAEFKSKGLAIIIYSPK